MSDTFTCAHCGGTYDKEWSDKEAQAEADEVFGDALGDDVAVVCDDCYRMMDAAIPMREWATPQASDTDEGGV